MRALFIPIWMFLAPALFLFGCSKADPQLLTGDWVQVRYQVEIDGGDQAGQGEFKVAPDQATVLQFYNGQVTVKDKQGTRAWPYRVDGNDLWIADGPVESRWEIEQLNETTLRLRARSITGPSERELELIFRRV